MPGLSRAQHRGGTALRPEAWCHREGRANRMAGTRINTTLIDTTQGARGRRRPGQAPETGLRPARPADGSAGAGRFVPVRLPAGPLSRADPMVRAASRAMPGNLGLAARGLGATLHLRHPAISHQSGPSRLVMRRLVVRRLVVRRLAQRRPVRGRSVLRRPAPRRSVPRRIARQHSGPQRSRRRRTARRGPGRAAQSACRGCHSFCWYSLCLAAA